MVEGTIDQMQNHKACIVEVELAAGTAVYTGSGTSWRMSEDAHDPDIGELVATYRAVRDLLRSMERDYKKATKNHGSNSSEGNTTEVN